MNSRFLSHFAVAVLVFIATTLYWRQQHLARQNAVLRDYWVLKSEHDQLISESRIVAGEFQKAIKELAQR